jgi:TrmH family RNA methyltransferase
MPNWKHLVSFVLVEPTEPGNIGASARAIKNMGFKGLAVVNPPEDPEGGADRMAHNATDVLKAAKEYSSFNEAVSEAALVIGTSRRTGKRRGTFVAPEEGARKVQETALRGGRVSVLFGRERVGLSDAEIDECAYVVNIPTDTRHPSLNIAQAVMVMAYEIGKLQMELPGDKEILSTHAEEAELSEKLRQVLELIGYTKMGDRTIARKILVSIKRFLGRASLAKDELDTLNGIVTRLTKRLDK